MYWFFFESPPHSLIVVFFFPLSPMQLLLYLTSAPVIVFCRSGRRAGKAKETLEQLGYTKVLNAGGLEDLVSKLE